MKRILLSKFMIRIYVVISILLIIHIISKIQIYNKYKNFYQGTEIKPYNGIQSFDVEGMSDEEIDELLDSNRNGDNSEE